MKQIWRSTSAGSRLTASPPWSLAIQDEKFELTVQGRTRSGDVAQLEGCGVTPGLFWAAFKVVGPNQKLLQLDGIPNARAHQLKAAIAAAVAATRHREEVAQLVERFDRLVQPVGQWAHQAVDHCRARLRQRGWIHSRPRSAKEKL